MLHNGQITQVKKDKFAQAKVFATSSPSIVLQVRKQFTFVQYRRLRQALQKSMYFYSP